jgi:cyanophycinase
MSKGKLIIIGGREDKEDKQTILKEVVRLVPDDGVLLIVTIATHKPEEVAKEYTAVFKKLEVKNVDVLDIRTREDGLRRENIDKINQASLVFFTGGDQLRITSQMGDTPVYSALHERHKKGLHIVGTSAGAAVMPETMLVNGENDESNHIHTLGMAPGLGVIEDVVIDSHFAERGRIGRLLGAVSQNPANLGLGIDENTAIIVDQDKHFRVIGDGAVYVVDGTGMTYSSLSEDETDGILTIYDVKLHVLAEGQKFDLAERQPVLKEEKATEGSAK